MARDLPLGRIGRGDREVVGAAELLGQRQHPFDQALEMCPRRPHLPGGEIDQLAREAVANRAPEVLLDQPVLEVRHGLALVQGARDPRSQRVAERGQRARLNQVGLPSQILISTIGKARCGRTLHQSCVCSLIERVS